DRDQGGPGSGAGTATDGEPGTAAEPVRELDLGAGVHRVHEPGAGEHLSLTSTADEVLVHTLPIAPGQGLAVAFESPLLQIARTASDSGLDVLLRAPSDAPPAHAPGKPPVRWDEDAPHAAIALRWRREGAHGLLVCAISTTWRGLGERPARPTDEVATEAS